MASRLEMRFNGDKRDLMLLGKNKEGKKARRIEKDVHESRVQIVLEQMRADLEIELGPF